jgi:predicted DsbA family dithiol-disulfide isomerase
VKRVYGDRLHVTWRHFSLEQANSKEGPDWKVWEQSDPAKTNSLPSQIALEAVGRQGKDDLDSYYLALLTARHGGKGRIALNETGPLLDLARDQGLDVQRFRRDMAEPSMAETIGRDHTEAVEKHGVFGTPTFVFAGGGSAYLKTFIPPEEDSATFFEHFAALASERTYFGEIKRPQPPWPKGAVLEG